MDGARFRELGYRAVDHVADLLDSLRDKPVNRDLTPAEIRALLPADLPLEGQDAETLLDETAQTLFDNSLFNGHPNFLGYITSSAAPIGALADLLAASVNPNLGGWQLSPVASEIEGQTVRWIGEMMGYPVGGGLLVSGGSMANMTAFFAALRNKLGQTVRRSGLIGASERPTVYASRETHFWLQKATDLSGLGTDSLRWIDVDERGCIRLDRLQEMIRQDRDAGCRPFMVVGTGGSVSTGAIDALDQLAEIAAREDLWFHVDGAYGALAALVPELHDRFRGLDLADSVAVDPHKWLYAPLEAGCTLVRDAQTLPDAFSYTPVYYHFGGEEDPRINYYELGLQNSRGFRALKVWLAIRQVGKRGYERMIGDDCRVARALYDAVVLSDDLEALGHDLSITTFRYAPAQMPPGVNDREAWLDEINIRLLERLKASGELFVSNAVVAGRFALRACVVNFRTTFADVEAIPGIVLKHARKLD
jgi:aromatic-L-amino-acid decarboxylase